MTLLLLIIIKTQLITDNDTLFKDMLILIIISSIKKYEIKNNNFISLW